MALSLASTVPHSPPLPSESEKHDQKLRGWHRFSLSRWLGKDDQSQCPDPIAGQERGDLRPGLGRRMSRKVVPGLPRPATFRRQNSERRDRLARVEPTTIERRAASVDRRRALSARPASPRPCAVPKLSAPEVGSRFLSTTEEPSSLLNPASQLSPRRHTLSTPPPTPPPALESRSIMSEASYDDQTEEDQLKAELEERWILNLSMCFRDRSPREKFFITYAETSTRWRRVTVSCDYRDAPSDSLERDLQALQYQRDKNARIYESIRMSLPEIQFFDTVTNLKLETSNDDRLHVHVTEDTNEIIPYPLIHSVQHLDCKKYTESEVHFASHLSGFVYKVKVDSQTFIKKEIPGPDSVEEFLYEVNALNALDGSSNVIQFQGLVVDDSGNLVKGLLISFAEQGALVDLVFDMKGTLPWTRRERWAAQIIRGLSEIHEAGFVQGDFTLSNIVIDEDDTARIIDINRRGCPVGWEPPEVSRLIESSQRISMYIGVKSDLFQLGMVLWALAHEEDEPERRPKPLAQQPLRPDTPAYYRELVSKCLSQQPRDRSAAKDLLPLIPAALISQDVLSPPAVKVSSECQQSHHSSLPSETRYIDPSQAVSREDLERHRPKDTASARDLERDFASDSHTYINPPEPNNDANDPNRPIDFDGPGSYIVPRRGRTLPANLSHLDSYQFPTPPASALDRARSETSPGHYVEEMELDDDEPQIVAVSPTGVNRWEEVEIDGNPYLVQKGSLVNLDNRDGSPETERGKQGRRRGRSPRRFDERGEDTNLRTSPFTQQQAMRSQQVQQRTLSMEHVDSGLADMDLTGIGGHESLTAGRELSELQRSKMLEEERGETFSTDVGKKEVDLSQNHHDSMKQHQTQKNGAAEHELLKGKRLSGFGTPSTQLPTTLGS
ncbi:hypothetical protein MMC09_006642 [Bachmanniomyces sp. S44760]|nr:hypothetical protein [Bachmanniomyces sp. S44760]